MSERRYLIRFEREAKPNAPLFDSASTIEEALARIKYRYRNGRIRGESVKVFRGNKLVCEPTKTAGVK
jgi:hypothetical protein